MSRDSNPGRDDGEGRKIFVGGLNHSADSEAVSRDFGRFGQIDDIYIPTDKETGRPRGFAFITYKDPRDAEDASQEMNRCGPPECD